MKINICGVYQEKQVTHTQNTNLRLTPLALEQFLVGVLSTAAAIR